MLSVRLSVRPSVKRVICDKTKETCANILIPHVRSYILVFCQEDWLVRATPCIWNFGLNWPCWSENADFQSTFASGASAVTPSEKSSINTNKKSTTRFPMSLRWTSYAAPKPQRGLKTQNGRLRVKLHFTWRKSAIKYLCVNTVSDKVVRHSLAFLSVHSLYQSDTDSALTLFNWRFQYYAAVARYVCDS